MLVSLLFGLLPYWNYTDIDNSSSGWDIFLKYFGGILAMFVHLYQIILKFLYVCQSVIWLILLLKWHKFRYLQFWMRYLAEISLRHSQDFHTQFPNNSDFFMSVSLLVGYILTDIRHMYMGLSPLLDEIYFRKFLETLLGCLHTNSK